MSPRAVLVTIAVYGVKDFDGVSLTRGYALQLFNGLSIAAEINREKPCNKGYHVVDVGIEGNEDKGSVYAWIDCVDGGRS
jgi:hypothetical protein